MTLPPLNIPVWWTLRFLNVIPVADAINKACSGVVFLPVWGIEPMASSTKMQVH